MEKPMAVIRQKIFELIKIGPTLKSFTLFTQPSLKSNAKSQRFQSANKSLIAGKLAD